MAGKNQVTLTLVGDSDQLEKTFKRVGEASEKMAREVKDSSHSIDGARESFDKAEQRAQGFRDGVTGAQDSVAGFSALLKGDVQNGLLLMGSGLADSASAMANGLLPAIKSAVVKLGVLKFALLGVGAAAIVGTLAFFAFQKFAQDAEDHTEELIKDLKVLSESGILTGRLKDAFGAGGNAAKDFADKLQLLSKEAERHVSAAGARGANLYQTYLTQDQQKAVKALEELDGALETAIKNGENVDDVQSALNEAFGETNVQLAITQGRLPKYAAAAEDAAERSDALKESVELTARHFKLAAENLQTYTNLLKAQTDPVFGFVNAQNQLADAQQRIFDLEAANKRLPLEVAKAQQELNDAINEFGKNSLEAAEARQSLNELTQKAADYDRDHETAVLDLAKAQLGLVDATSKLQTVNENELLPTLEQLRRDGYLTEDAFKALSKIIGQTQAAVNTLDGSRARVAIDIQGYYTQYGAHLAQQQIASTIIDEKWRNVPEFALGGTVPGMPWEEVPAILHGGETVTPAGKSADSGTTVIVYVDGVKAVQRHVKNNGGVVQEALMGRF